LWDAEVRTGGRPASRGSGRIKLALDDSARDRSRPGGRRRRGGESLAAPLEGLRDVLFHDGHLGIDVRAGLHTGKVLVSSTVKDWSRARRCALRIVGRSRFGESPASGVSSPWRAERRDGNILPGHENVMRYGVCVDREACQNTFRQRARSGAVDQGLRRRLTDTSGAVRTTGFWRPASTQLRLHDAGNEDRLPHRGRIRDAPSVQAGAVHAAAALDGRVDRADGRGDRRGGDSVSPCARSCCRW